MTYDQPGARARAYGPSGGAARTTTPGERRRYKSSGSAKRGRNGRKQRPTWRKFLGWKAFVLYFLGAVLLFIIGVGIAYTNTPIPSVANAETQRESTIVYWNDGETELGRFEQTKRIPVGYDEMPQHLRDAVVAAEDRSFYDNEGFDPVGIARAGLGFVTSGGEIEGGGSTISQQYVKNMYFTKEQTLSRKVDELFVSIKVNQEMDKNDILTNYLNLVWFGGTTHGVEVASQRVFGHSASELTLAESASLAALIKNPGIHDPRIEDNQQRFEERFQYVINGMAEIGAIDEATASATQPPGLVNEDGECEAESCFEPIKEDEAFEGTDGYLLAAVERELTKCRDVQSSTEDEAVDAESGNGNGTESVNDETIDCEQAFTKEQLNTGGYRIVTTFDQKKQKAAINAVKDEAPEDQLEHTHIGLAAVVPGDGAVVAAYGGQNYLEQAFDNSLRANPSVGSTIKPLTLVAALENGISLDSRFAGNSPYEHELLGSSPVTNQGDRDWGEYIDLIEATNFSVNSAFVDLVLELSDGNQDSGGQLVEDVAYRAGIPEDTPDIGDKGLRSTLGIAPISPVDLADAYATLAAGGRQADWYTVKEVTDGGGNVVYEGKDELETVIDPDIAAEITYALRSVVEDGSGHEAQALDRPSAGKTGTHQDKTLWYSGYVPQLSASVAIFRQDYETGEKLNLEEAYGGSSEYPARIWTAFMKAVMEGEDVVDFPERGNIGDPMNTPTPTSTTSPTDDPTEEPTEDAEETKVPNVVGRSLNDAIQRLSDRGLSAGNVTEQETDQASPGTVISSNPQQGTEVEAGSSVDLVVAKEPEEFAMPDVERRAEQDAVDHLRSLGLQVDVQYEDPTAPEYEGLCGVVVDQDPDAGATVRSGDKVRIAVPKDDWDCDPDDGDDGDGNGNNGEGNGPDNNSTVEPGTTREESGQ